MGHLFHLLDWLFLFYNLLDRFLFLLKRLFDLLNNWICFYLLNLLACLLYFLNRLLFHLLHWLLL